MRYKAYVTRTQEAVFEFDANEIEEGDDEFIAANEISESLSERDWTVEHVEVDVYELP